ncbi:MAG TPA: hypothetical protein VFO76_11355 [Candidatus Kapabacteria bacterium]|nr:hypothetical protein [Candidatus Kapabacteria bacterium]
MKKGVGFIFCCFIALAIYSGCKKGPEPGQVNSFKRYSFKNAHLTLKHSGDSRGTEELYIADYGKYEARVSNIEMFRGEGLMPRQSIDLTRLAELYNVNMLNHQVRHQHNPMLDSLYHLPESDIPSPTEFYQTQMKGNYFKFEAVDTALGYKAERWYQPESKALFWIWNTLAIKQMYSTGNGFIGITMVALDTNWVVDTNYFNVPGKGFDVHDIGPNEQLQQM